MEESKICSIGVKGDMLHNSQSKDILQHHGSNTGGTSNKHTLEEDKSSNFIKKNSSLVSPVYCTQESGEEHPEPEARTGPCDSQQDLECNRNEAKTSGKEVLLLMQALSTLSAPEEKLAALCKKYADLLEDSRHIQRQMKIMHRKQDQIVTEKVHLQSEHSKAVLESSKLGSLGWELQRHNKTIKEENMQQAREEESRKKATSRFQFTLNGIQAQLEQYELHNAQLEQENIELGENLKKLTKLYTLRKEQIDKVFKHKELQQQLVDAKLQQTTELIKEADKKHHREREFLLKEATESRHRYEEMKHHDVQLKQQLSLYMVKFEELQTVVENRIDVFTTSRQKLEKMMKKIEKLQKEMIMWRTKLENNNKVLMQMTEEKTIRDREYKSSQMKLERLEKLFRALQMERNELREKVEVLKEQVSVPAANVNSATPVMKPCTALDSQKELSTSSRRPPGVYLQGEPKGVKRTKRRSKDPFHMISSGH